MVGINNLVLFAGAVLAVPVVDKRAAQTVPGSYIITLKPGVEPQSHLRWVGDVHARSATKRDSNGVGKVYNIDDFKGYSGTFDEATVEQIKGNDQVASVEPNMVWNLNALVTQPGAPWGLGSVSHRAPNSTDYIYDDTAGVGTYAYIIDTGLYTEHNEFEGRAQLGYNAYPGSEFVDNYGHGTHTAGTIGSRAYGVAKKTTLISVKVFDWGSSTTEIVLDGYTWAANNITASGRQASSVISMSLGGPVSEAFNAAVAAAYKAGVLSVVAAGNDMQDAKNVSPASAKDAVTVGAIDSANTMAWFSNFGRVVDIFGPGVDVLSTFIGSPDATERMDGTSMATPHVAGLVLYLKGLDPKKNAKPGNVSRRLKDLGTEDVIQGLTKNTKNLIAYNGNA